MGGGGAPACPQIRRLAEEEISEDDIEDDGERAGHVI